MAKRPRYSRWRRLPGVFRSGENRPNADDDALDRIILYLPSRLLDLAEKLAEKTGEPSVQHYCESLLKRAIELERINQKVADVEAKRGRLEGLDEIASDPDYLAEWQRRAAASGERERATALPPPSDDDEPALPPPEEGPIVVEIVNNREDFDRPGAADAAVEVDWSIPGQGASRPRLHEPGEGSRSRAVVLMSDSTSMAILARHVGWAADDWGFLPCLRRGEAVPAAKAAELIWGLHQIEDELKGAATLDRALAHALHRLALESQVLLTDAWPGAFDEPVITAIRSVQEAVERILSGQDIRYYSNRRSADVEPPL